MSTPYVKFFRGTPEAFEKLVDKNNDTLYFISATDEKTGKLYLGNKLISDNINTVAELEDILLSELSDGNLLTYDGEQSKWVNKSVLDAIGLFTGATETEQGTNGLVPAPGMGMQNTFLRGDGKWVTIENPAGSNLTADEKSISITNEVIVLKDFGVKYYKFVPETDEVAAHYEAQLVDSEHPWKEGLEPRVVEENEELILGWFEPNTITVEGLTNQITTLQGKVDEVAEEVKTKANTADVFTKEETTEQINQAIAKTDHMIRKVFESLGEAETFAILQGEEAEKYIYMVKDTTSLDEQNKYNEYLYVNESFELIGNWETDLADYATKEELKLKVDKVEGKSLVDDIEIEKLATVTRNAEPNFIKSVDETELKVEDGLLSIVSIGSSKITDLEELLNTKADKTAVEEINEQVTNLETELGVISGKVEDLASQLGTYVTMKQFNDEISEIKQAVTWQLI